MSYTLCVCLVDSLNVGPHPSLSPRYGAAPMGSFCEAMGTCTCIKEPYHSVHMYICMMEARIGTLIKLIILFAWCKLCIEPGTWYGRHSVIICLCTVFTRVARGLAVRQPTLWCVSAWWQHSNLLLPPSIGKSAIFSNFLQLAIYSRKVEVSWLPAHRGKAYR